MIIIQYGGETNTAILDSEAGPDGPARIQCHTYGSPSAPPLVIDERFNGGKPTSVFDLLHAAPKGKRLVPVAGKTYLTVDQPGDLVPVTPAKAHAMASEAKGRGRPITVPLSVASGIKTAYYKRKCTIAAIAAETDLDPQTVSAIVKGKRLWYA